MGDVTQSVCDGMETKTLEHRLKVAMQAFSDERAKACAWETQLRSKEREMLAALTTAQDHEEQRAEQYEADLRSVSSKLRATQVGC